MDKLNGKNINGNEIRITLKMVLYIILGITITVVGIIGVCELLKTKLEEIEIDPKTYQEANELLDVVKGPTAGIIQMQFSEKEFEAFVYNVLYTINKASKSFKTFTVAAQILNQRLSSNNGSNDPQNTNSRKRIVSKLRDLKAKDVEFFRNFAKLIFKQALMIPDFREVAKNEFK